MSDIVISTKNLTKDYGRGRGIFDISIEVRKGEVYGFIGTNGSGKTTTIRHLMGFLKPDRGTAGVMGMDSWKRSIEIKPFVGYVPGEIAFPNLKNGTDFLKLQAEYLGVNDFHYMNELIRRFQLEPAANLKRMSKGMKQKTALVAALMGNRDVLILDEPTTGLDPLMRDVFLDIIRNEKAKGKTIFMSSHIFEEIEEVCDKTAMIKDGRIIEITEIHELRHPKTKIFTVEFMDSKEAERFSEEPCFAEGEKSGDSAYRIEIAADNIGRLMNILKNYRVKSLSETHETLEGRFHKAYIVGRSPKDIK